MKIGQYEIWFMLFPFYKDEEIRKIIFARPKFKFENLRKKPCSTTWLYEWIFDFGYLTIFKKQKMGRCYETIETIWETNRRNGIYAHDKVVVTQAFYDEYAKERLFINPNYTQVKYSGIDVVPSNDVSGIMFTDYSY